MNGYPTDEELGFFIEEIEKEELYAPAHMKEEILARIKETEQLQEKKAGFISFPVYAFKITVGMAAALLLVFLLPAGGGKPLKSDNGRELHGLFRMELLEVKDFYPNWERKGIRLDKKIDSYIEERKKEADELLEKFNRSFNGNHLGGNDYES